MGSGVGEVEKKASADGGMVTGKTSVDEAALWQRPVDEQFEREQEDEDKTEEDDEKIEKGEDGDEEAVVQSSPEEAYYHKMQLTNAELV